ncbi:MAG: hypothetical protein H0V56_03480 [Chthoniobacterales bacterium]|nr:hypothetical protein [Chthoniobacterales bacterium]
MNIARIFSLLLALIATTFFVLPSGAAQTAVSPKAAGAKQAVDSAAMVYAPSVRSFPQANVRRDFPWRNNIVTTVFWVGEKPTPNNPTPNNKSSWDQAWTTSFGGYDDPNPARRRNMLPIAFTPRQNPFYVALPYNDKARVGHHPEAPHVVPWFKEAYQGPAVSTVKGRWVAIRKGDRIAYAQWEDAGPFRTDHWQYVFGNERPKPNLNKGAGLDVSPAVRDFLGMQDTDVTDWKFVEFKDVPPGPWARLGDNNTFVINQRKNSTSLVQGRKPSAEITPR